MGYVKELPSGRFRGVPWHAKAKKRGKSESFAGYVGELYGVTVDSKRINLWHHRGELRKVDTDPE